ncbi:hypothetical protein FHT76_000388 [Rhizobium sp. BK176]|nr:DUF1471 domain-containing protein [Rhizobium sp. BK176]MCS4088799.1 hypothetical protein [Rhizobium sp. BK176]
MSVLEAFDWSRFNSLDKTSATKFTNCLFDEKVMEEASWPTLTDVDRLYAAFSALAADGFVSVHNPSDSPSDAEEEVKLAFQKAQRSSSDKWAAVYYHDQNVDDAMETGRMNVTFLVFREYFKFHSPDAAFEAAGMYIVKALNDNGLKTHWNGDPKSLIEVFMDWKKRSPKHAR